MKRRDFIRLSTAGTSSLLFAGPLISEAPGARDPKSPPNESRASEQTAGLHLPNLAPAKWIWYPSARCLANTFVLFRRAFQLSAKPRRAVGWIAADSRYRLEVNGRRVQWGPAPCDPRWAE